MMAGAGLTIMGAAFPLVAAGAKASADGLAALLDLVLRPVQFL